MPWEAGHPPSWSENRLHVVLWRARPKCCQLKWRLENWSDSQMFFESLSVVPRHYLPLFTSLTGVLSAIQQMNWNWWDGFISCKVYSSLRSTNPQASWVWAAYNHLGLSQFTVREFSLHLLPAQPRGTFPHLSLGAWASTTHGFQALRLWAHWTGRTGKMFLPGRMNRRHGNFSPISAKPGSFYCPKAVS